MAKDLDRSRLKRALRLSKLGARVALQQGRRLVTRDEASIHREVATALVRELGELKGLPMKIGQLLSYMEGLVPDEYREIYQSVLGELRTHSTPMADDAWREVLEDELGREAEEIFDEFDAAPIAAASIGQVHRAVYRGRAVCVKIQYPGIAEATLSDLENIDAVVALMRTMMPSVDTRQMIEDFRVRLAEECDYRKEAEYQRRFAAIHEDDPDLFVPEVIDDLCTGRVLTTVLVSGRSLEEFAADASELERDRAAEALFRFAFGTLLSHGLFHADPHPGNLIFNADGSGRLCVLDYGCVQPIDDAARLDIAALLSAAVDGEDLSELTLTALGITDADERTHHAITEITRLVLAPIIEPQPYGFTRSFATEIARAVVEAKARLATGFLTRRSRFVADREGVMFIVRNLFGLASIWGTLEARGEYRALTAKLVADARRSPRTPHLAVSETG